MALKSLKLLLSCLLLVACEQPTTDSVPGCDSKGKSRDQNPHCTPDVSSSGLIPATMKLDSSGEGLLLGGFYFMNQIAVPKIEKLNMQQEPDDDFNANAEGILPLLTNYSYAQINNLEVLPDGKILALGSAYFEDVQGAQSHVILFKLLPDGSLDTSFGNSGLVTTTLINTNANSARSMSGGVQVLVQSDSKILVLANNTWFLSNFVNMYGFDLDVIRYNSDGSLDLSFGTNGIATAKAGDPGSTQAGVPYSALSGHSMALTSSGKIVVGGESAKGGDPHHPTTGGKFTLVRFNSNGTLDSSFGNSGVSRFENLHNDANNSALWSICTQNDGKIIGGGRFAYNTNNEWFYTSTIIRVATNGTLDSTFGTGGMVKTSVTDWFAEDWYGYVSAVSLTSDGKIFFTKDSKEPYLGRLNSDGSVDNTYGTNGITILDTNYYFPTATVIGNDSTYLLGIDHWEYKIFEY